ncbi:hypothetical protein GGP65_002027 [Salinibacter ruber]|uniref:hypothetical protein n=1 Tax=Salinibacter ruber TaxID=146919 RepID=UPI002168F80D|nr:hypothetical protein [Salinibacter ruber]MCS3664402.1 hypothetical protein [Salinibacter ruber]
MSDIELSSTDRNSVKSMSKYIEENIRSDETSGIDFIDPRDHEYRLRSRQNHVIYGRRGAGKTTLISQIHDTKDLVSVNIDVEHYKDISFPNIVLHILNDILKKLSVKIDNQCPVWKGHLKANWYNWFTIKSKIKEIENTIMKPDKVPKSVTEKKHSNAELSFGKTISTQASRGQSRQVDEEFVDDKIRDLLRQLSSYKKAITESLRYIGNPDLFIMMDDFYFADKRIQPDLIDYFHRITKNESIYLKVATIKNRSKLYRKDEGHPVGTEIRHDIHDIDMDYTLDDFTSLKNFMESLMDRVAEQSDGSFYNTQGLFAGDGFNTLCLASGGVPRDFLSLYRSCLDNFILRDSTKIGVKQVREIAINRIDDKKKHLQEDATKESEILDAYLNKIVDYVYRKKRRNVFLVAKEELDQFPKSRQAIMELVDLRLIHLIDRNTSKAPSDGRQYEGYMIDVGLYENTKPREFTEVQPGAVDSESRKPKLRSSPDISLPELESKIQHRFSLDPLRVSTDTTTTT